MSIIELIADIPTNAVLREQAKALEKKIVDLEQQNDELKKRIKEIESQLAAKTAADDLVEHRGVYFKRQQNGGYTRTVLCIVCRKPMSSSQQVLNYRCMCGYVADFTGRQLDEVMRSLPK
jgi:hypothetical protein